MRVRGHVYCRAVSSLLGCSEGCNCMFIQILMENWVYMFAQYFLYKMYKKHFKIFKVILNTLCRLWTIHLLGEDGCLEALKAIFLLKWPLWFRTYGSVLLLCSDRCPKSRNLIQHGTQRCTLGNDINGQALVVKNFGVGRGVAVL